MPIIVLSQQIGYEVHLGFVDGGHANLVIVVVDFGKDRIYFTITFLFL